MARFFPWFIRDHDHSGDTGDGGQFDVVNLESGYQTAGAILVSGAGSGSVNGIYVLDGTANGKTKYKKDNADPDQTIEWTIWGNWALYGYDDDVWYYSLDDVATPDLASWSTSNGTAPAPTITTTTEAANGYMLFADGSGNCQWEEAAWLVATGTGRHFPSSTATGALSTGEGSGCTASGDGSHAEGIETTASGDGAHAEGFQTTASGDGAHAEGWYCEASGLCSHAGGYHSEAAHQGSLAHGEYAKTRGKFCFAHGRNNASQLVTFELVELTATATPEVMDVNAVPLTVPTDCAWAFRARIVGGSDDMAEVAAYEFVGLIKNASGTVSFVGTPSKTVLGEDNAAWDCSVSANNTDNRLDFTVTGAAGTAIYWAGTVFATEVYNT